MIMISGEALIDLIPDPVKADAYDAVLGGSPYNVAIGLARLGAPTAFVCRLSADGNGEALAGALAENGVDLSFVARDMRPTSLALTTRACETWRSTSGPIASRSGVTNGRMLGSKLTVAREDASRIASTTA